MMCITNSVQD